jgi:orotidine-5'-phosphate decarboxylase
MPDMARKFSATCKEAGVDGLILFPIAGPRAVVAFAGGAYHNRLLPIVGGDLPFPDYNAGGGGSVIDDALDKIFRKAIEIGVDHFVVPGNTPAKVRHHARWLVEKVERPSLFVPGIGALGGSIADAFAAAPGCNVYAVVGRAIYDALDPAEAALRLAGEAQRFG